MTCGVDGEPNWTESARDLVGALAAAARAGHGKLYVVAGMQDSMFLEEHVGHDVRVLNEYGDVLPDFDEPDDRRHQSGSLYGDDCCAHGGLPSECPDMPRGATP